MVVRTPYSEAVRPTRLDHISRENLVIEELVQRNFSTIGNQYGGQRFGSWCSSRVEAGAVGSHQLAREVSRLSKSTHDHGENCEEL